MQSLTTQRPALIRDDSMVSSFVGDSGVEWFVTLEAPRVRSFEAGFRELLDRYDRLISDRSITGDSLVSMKFHVSDISNQISILRQVLAERQESAQYTIIEQPPASGSKVALEAYHLMPREGVLVKQVTADGLLIAHGVYGTLFGQAPVTEGLDSAEQTVHMLDRLSAATQQLGGTVSENLLRTWFYVRDIDNNYQGMVDARREWFIDEGLTEDTHYVASTGIEGRGGVVSDLVHLDYISQVGIQPEQITYMSALENLNPTHEYGVTFERATRVQYGDRSHYYISGTASIDSRGEVLHVGDVVKQGHRTLDNIEALLQGYGGCLEDLRSLVVYLRDSADLPLVRQLLAERIPPGISYIIVRGAVCRPTWLIEMDGLAVNGVGDPGFANYC